MMVKQKARIAIGQISSESNHFVSKPCELEFFRNTGYVLEGASLFDLKGTATEVAGILSVLESAPGVEIVPLLAARANSAGPLSEACYSYLKQALLAELRSGGPLDGVIFSHHGSMATMNEDDPDGDIAQCVRALVGAAVPIVMTLDLHANVTRRMVEATNGILGYEHYPHDDVYTTGERGARLLLRAVRREVRPVIGHAKLPMLLSPYKASTNLNAPYGCLMHQAKDWEREEGILSASVFYVGSFIDMPDMGCSVAVVADGDAGLAQNRAKHLAEKFWSMRHEFSFQTYTLTEALRLGRNVEEGPILLLDSADTTGGGASGDSTWLVKGLLEAELAESCLAMVVDPEAAAACGQAGEGSIVTVRLGHKLDPSWGEPIAVSGRVVRTFDGRFRYQEGGILGGAWATMGPSAVLVVRNVQILIATHATYDWADEQYRAAGMQPEQAKFVGVKNMMNFRFGYRDIMKGFFLLDLPGPTAPDLRTLNFKRASRPLFPLDSCDDVPMLQMSKSADI